MLQLAERILQSKATDFDPSQFVDRYEEAVIELFKRKQAGIPASRKHAPPRPQNAVNLMEALRRSIAEGRAGSIPPRRAKRQGETGLSNLRKRDKQSAAKSAGRPTIRKIKAG